MASKVVKKCISLPPETLSQIQVLKEDYFKIPDGLSFSAVIQCIVDRLYWIHMSEHENSEA